jgi:hypothetical protein
MDDNFIKKYKAFDNQSIEAFLKNLSTTQAELRDIIASLIRHRETMRDSEIEKLDAEASALIRKLSENKTMVLLEELDCFRDILALQKKLLGQNDEQRNRGEDT